MSPRHSPPFDHRVRRRILRQLHTDFGRHYIDDLARELCLDAREVDYHSKVLARWKTVSRTEGPSGFLLQSLVADQPEVIRPPMATKAEDETA